MHSSDAVFTIEFFSPLVVDDWETSWQNHTWTDGVLWPRGYIYQGVCWAAYCTDSWSFQRCHKVSIGLGSRLRLYAFDTRYCHRMPHKGATRTAIAHAALSHTQHYRTRTAIAHEPPSHTVLGIAYACINLIYNFTAVRCCLCACAPNWCITDECMHTYILIYPVFGGETARGD